MKQSWQEATEWERSWWGDCSNTYNEETKQYLYARYMGLDEFATNWYGRRGWDMGDKKVLDIGGGPCSILLKSKARERIVLDPCQYPNWVNKRYEECGLSFWNIKGEELNTELEFDEVLIYNCLQHTEDPEKILSNAKKVSKLIRIFEWIETGVADGHLHNLTEDSLNKWLGGEGKAEMLNASPLVGKCYYGIFKGDRYGK